MHDPDNGMPLKTSIKIMNQMIQQKVDCVNCSMPSKCVHTQMFIESKDEIALVLFGTSGNYFICLHGIAVASYMCVYIYTI